MQWRAWLGIDDLRPEDAPLIVIAKNVGCERARPLCASGAESTCA